MSLLLRRIPDSERTALFAVSAAITEKKYTKAFALFASTILSQTSATGWLAEQHPRETKFLQQCQLCVKILHASDEQCAFEQLLALQPEYRSLLVSRPSAPLHTKFASMIAVAEKVDLLCADFIAHRIANVAGLLYEIPPVLYSNVIHFLEQVAHDHNHADDTCMADVRACCKLFQSKAFSSIFQLSTDALQRRVVQLFPAESTVRRLHERFGQILALSASNRTREALDLYLEHFLDEEDTAYFDQARCANADLHAIITALRSMIQNESFVKITALTRAQRQLIQGARTNRLAENWGRESILRDILGIMDALDSYSIVELATKCNTLIAYEARQFKHVAAMLSNLCTQASVAKQQTIRFVFAAVALKQVLSPTTNDGIKHIHLLIEKIPSNERQAFIDFMWREQENLSLKDEEIANIFTLIDTVTSAEQRLNDGKTADAINIMLRSANDPKYRYIFSYFRTVKEFQVLQEMVTQIYTTDDIRLPSMGCLPVQCLQTFVDFARRQASQATVQQMEAICTHRQALEDDLAATRFASVLQTCIELMRQFKSPMDATMFLNNIVEWNHVTETRANCLSTAAKILGVNALVYTSVSRNPQSDLSDEQYADMEQSITHIVKACLTSQEVPSDLWADFFDALCQYNGQLHSAAGERCRAMNETVSKYLKNFSKLRIAISHNDYHTIEASCKELEPIFPVVFSVMQRQNKSLLPQFLLLFASYATIEDKMSAVLSNASAHTQQVVNCIRVLFQARSVLRAHGIARWRQAMAACALLVPAKQELINRFDVAVRYQVNLLHITNTYSLANKEMRDRLEVHRRTIVTQLIPPSDTFVSTCFSVISKLGKRFGLREHAALTRESRRDAPGVTPAFLEEFASRFFSQYTSDSIVKVILPMLSFAKISDILKKRPQFLEKWEPSMPSPIPDAIEYVKALMHEGADEPEIRRRCTERYAIELSATQSPLSELMQKKVALFLSELAPDGVHSTNYAALAYLLRAIKILLPVQVGSRRSTRRSTRRRTL